jgi:LacI family transcriptional regulator, repressor for deo operon, udp, cdd, tsx, nupC, and nupG
MKPGPRSPPRMRDVATLAGVSATTVSRAFTAPEVVSLEVRQRIEKAVRKLKYTPNLNARSLRRSSTGVVIVLLPDIGNPFFSVLLKAIEETARNAGRAILIGDTAKDVNLAATYALELDAQRADGMILLNGFLPFRDSRGFSTSRVRHPVVVVSERIPDAKFPSVAIDNVAAAQEVIEFLAQAGHRRIGHIGGPPENILTRQRLQGYQEGLAAMGLSNGKRLVTFGDFSIESGREAARRLLHAAPRITAIFAGNDEMAVGAIIELKSLGRRIPEDISVVGFDDIEFAGSYDPAITTVHQPRRDMGRIAMEMMNDLLDQRPLKKKQIVLEHKLIVRRSTGIARG